MSFNQILKVTAISFLSAFSFFSTTNIALADYLTSQGSGGNYRYELWSSDDNNTYYLKIWQNDADPETYPDSIGGFATSREALIYFDCNYSGLDLPECSQ